MSWRLWMAPPRGAFSTPPPPPPPLQVLICARAWCPLYLGGGWGIWGDGHIVVASSLRCHCVISVSGSVWCEHGGTRSCAPSPSVLKTASVVALLLWEAYVVQYYLPCEWQWKFISIKQTTSTNVGAYFTIMCDMNIKSYNIYVINIDSQRAKPHPTVWIPTWISMNIYTSVYSFWYVSIYLSCLDCDGFSKWEWEFQVEKVKVRVNHLAQAMCVGENN